MILIHSIVAVNRRKGTVPILKLSSKLIVPSPKLQAPTKTYFNMLAESRNSKRETMRSIPSLAGNGSNVRAWETGVHSALQLQEMNCLLLPDYNMHVSADKTLALDLKRQVDRAIRTGHQEVVTRARLVTAEAAVAKSRKMKAEEALEAKNMPKLEPIEAVEAVEAEETKEQVEVHEVSSTMKEKKMLARAAIIAERMQTQALTTERRGAQHTVFYLNPLTALDLDDEEDRDGVCHVYCTRCTVKRCDMHWNLNRMLSCE